MNSLSRRRFLKISGATISAAAAVTSLSSVVKGAQKIDEKTGNPINGIQKIPTYCDVCFWKCGAIAYIKDGKLWKIEGNPDDPLSNGRLCPRGTGGIGAHYSEDRIKHPLIRKNERGEEKWVEVTWDEALEYVATKMKKIKREYGPESMALFSHGIGGTFLKHTMKAYGTNNMTAPSFAQCRGPREVGFEMTFGEGVGSPERTDIENAKCITFIGSHLGENMHNTQVQELSRAVENNASIIVVDPRFSVVASKAKYYLPIKPGTDIALLLAWMNVIVKEKLYDVDYVEKYGFGFDQFVAEIEDKTPEWAYTITTIEPDLIRKTAREMAKNIPSSFIHPGRHTTWYGDDTQRSRAIALLNALLGAWGRKGGFYLPNKFSVPKYSDYPKYPKSKKPLVHNPGHKYPFAEGEQLSTGIRDATINGKPYPIKGWFVYATNLLQALPNRDETIAAIKNLDLLVVVDIVPSEIAGWADVILPESTYLERYDDLNNAPFKQNFVSLRQPVVESPHDQKPNWWIAKKLADKLGVGHYFPWNNVEEYLDARLKKAGLSLAELKKKGVVKGEKQPIYFDEGIEPTFFTPSGKIEFYSLQLEEHGFDPIPKYTDHGNPPPGYYRLLFGRSPVHTFSKTQSYKFLKDAMSENEVWMNKNVADKLGLKSGEYVQLKNQDGRKSGKVKVRPTERIRTDCVYMVHGFGQTAKGMKTTYKKGGSDAQLVTKYNMDPIMGGTGMNVNYVTIDWEA
jgi:thiosulfate reductase / polysulfide reductase chain A